MSIWRDYRGDVEWTYRRPPRISLLLAGPILHRGLRAALLYRIAHRLHRSRPLRFLGALLKRVAYWTTGAEIHPAARIGGGLCLPHPQGVVIGPTVSIDGNAVVFQDVVLGPRNSESDQGPRIGLYAYLYPGARVIGDVCIGARTQVGPNCVVYRDIPEGSTIIPPEPTVLEGLSFGLRFSLREEPERPLEAVPSGSESR